MYTSAMQPLKQRSEVLAELAGPDHYLFTPRDLDAALPALGRAVRKVVLVRAERNGLLRRVCRGLYLYPRIDWPRGLLLHHAAARLRTHEFNYLSLESVLSDAGLIAQMPLNWLTLMSSGRTHTLDCGAFGHIEFVHTKKPPDAVTDQLVHDRRCRLWRAVPALALRDMRLTRRDMALVDREAVHVLV